MISTARRIQYAMGFLGLGLTADAAAELDAIATADHFLPDVLSARVEVHLAAKEWDLVASYARRLVAINPQDISGWVALGCAVRRVESVAAARAVLLRAESLLGQTHAIFHYNLACYNCLLGDLAAASERLANACRLDASFDATARTDPDLRPLWPTLRQPDPNPA